jgi:hypothetical protein
MSEENRAAGTRAASREDLKGTTYELFTLANAFLSRQPDEPQALADGSAQEALRNLERLLAEQQRATETLRAQLLKLESS